MSETVGFTEADTDAHWNAISAAMRAHPSVPAGEIAVYDAHLAVALPLIEKLLADLDEEVPADAKPFLRWIMESDVGAWIDLRLELDGDMGWDQPSRQFSSDAHRAVSAISGAFEAAKNARMRGG